jgi:hypothetical protein
MLGHADAGFTLRTYTHATRQKQDEAAATMGNFMAQALSNQPANAKIPDRKHKLPARYALTLSRNFAVWVTV